MTFNILHRTRILFSFRSCSRKLLRHCSHASRKKPDQFSLLREKLFLCDKGFSIENINCVKRDVITAGNRINSDNFDSLFIENCIQNKLFELGRQYFYHLYSENNLTLGLIRKFFRLCYHMNDTCSSHDKKLLNDLYNRIMDEYPYLDEMSYESLSMGLSVTDRWKEIIKLLNMSKEFGKPTNQLYSSLVRAAFYNNEKSLGWQYFEEMLINEIKPQESVYAAILFKADVQVIVTLFRLMEKYCLHVLNGTASFLKDIGVANITTVSHKGFCENCKNRLSKIIITESEFRELTTDFLDPTLIGQNIFIKSKPAELNNFMHFLKKSPKVDVVIDGLNVAYAGLKKNFSFYKNSKMLLDVVNYFIRNDNKVMVLGRQHMNKWTSQHMKFIKNNSSVFLAEDLSSDDPFLLYATMYSGLGTKFVSRDLMRGHKYLLKTAEKKKQFVKWQQKHQLFLKYVEKNGDVHLRDIGSYLMSPQCNGDRWHLPIFEPNQPGVHPHVQALNMKWICCDLKNKTNSEQAE